MTDYFNDNQKLWDEKTRFHEQSAFYNLAGFKAGKNMLNSIELEALGSVEGQSLLHLQCHFGLDTLSWARLGAKVTGIDFSAEAIALARKLSSELDIPAKFIQSNIYDLQENLSGQFDRVFTSYGTIIWLPDLVSWAKIISHFLKPGGIFYIVDFHPAYLQFDFDRHQVAYPYFNTGKPLTEKLKGTYADPDADIEMEEHFWSHSLEETIGALLGAGLNLLEFREFSYSPYNCFPNLEEKKPGQFVYTGTDPVLPHLFSLKMQK